MPGLYADITVPVLQVPAREEGGPGGPLNLMKQGKTEEDWEEKEDDDNDDELEGKRIDKEDIQDILMVEEGMIVKFPQVLDAIFAAPASRFCPARRI